MTFLLPNCTLSVFFSQVKSFIETQRALLADIQNGCKRNFILAKEKEETEQKMRQSVSMAEIATEDQAQEDEDVSAENMEEENTAGQGDATDEGSVFDSPEVQDQKPTLQEDSDSDTEDEDAAEEPEASADTTPPISMPAVNASTPPPPESPAGITVTESSAVPVAQASPGRCFSVSSPGRGHKIFMVTRVESPPKQQQMTALAKAVSESASESQTSTQTNIKAPSNQTASELSTLSSRAETTPAPVQPLNASSHADKQEKVKEAHASPSEIAQEPATPFESQKDAADQTHLERQLTVNTNTETLQNVSEKDQTLCSHTQTEPSVSGQSRDETLNPKAEPCPEQLREVQPGANGEKQEQSSEQQQEVTRGHEPLDEEDCSAQTGSPDQISTEEAEGPAVCTGTTLPNGLKPEFAFHLLEPEGPKPASCIMEHGELRWINTVFHCIILQY